MKKKAFLFFGIYKEWKTFSFTKEAGSRIWIERGAIKKRQAPN